VALHAVSGFLRAGALVRFLSYMYGQMRRNAWFQPFWRLMIRGFRDSVPKWQFILTYFLPGRPEMEMEFEMKEERPAPRVDERC